MLGKYANAFERFYATDAQILTRTSGGPYSERGKPKETTLTTIKADLQPIGGDMAAKDYGVAEECQVRMFCGYNKHIKTGNYVRAQGQLYRIVYVAPWTSPEVLLQFVREDEGDG